MPSLSVLLEATVSDCSTGDVGWGWASLLIGKRCCSPLVFAFGVPPDLVVRVCTGDSGCAEEDSLGISNWVSQLLSDQFTSGRLE